MDSRAYRFVWVISAIAFSSLAADIDAQRRAPGRAEMKQQIQVSLKAGGQMYQSSEPGKCTHAPVASIYNVVSEMWSVQQASEGRSLALSVWRPKNGSGDMVTLAVTTGNTSQHVSTVRGGSTTGSGKVTFEKSGNGGTFSVDARTSSGAAITGTIRCDAFAPHTAEGG
jgi:hypothetical protein